MKGYFEHMSTKHPHERRQHAMRVAGVLVGLVFVGWVTTLGIRTATGTDANVAATDNSNQTAAVLNYAPVQGNQLIVSTSTDN